MVSSNTALCMLLAIVAVATLLEEARAAECRLCFHPRSPPFCCTYEKAAGNDIARCPVEARTYCAGVRSPYDSDNVKSCSYDDDCGQDEKCCLDTCLQRRICKPAAYP